MQDDLKVELVSMWDGVNKDESRLAEFKLVFPDFNLPEFWRESDYLLLLIDLEKELQPVADRRFGQGRIRVESRELREGSVEIVLTLTAVGGAVYVFFKDYADLREGVLLFIKDVQALAAGLHKIMQRYFKHGNKRKDDPGSPKGGHHRGAKKGK